MNPRFFMKTTTLVLLSMALFIAIHVIVGLIFGALGAAILFGSICFLAFCVMAFVPVIKEEAELGDLLK
jgi:hypothetical protein